MKYTPNLGIKNKRSNSLKLITNVNKKSISTYLVFIPFLIVFNIKYGSMNTAIEEWNNIDIKKQNKDLRYLFSMIEYE